MSDGKPPVYLAVDLWQALGGDPSDFDGYYKRNGWAETWAVLLHAVRVARGQSRCGEYAPNIDGPCVLMKPVNPDTHVHHGANDVGRSEPLPFIVRSAQ